MQLNICCSQQWTNVCHPYHSPWPSVSEKPSISSSYAKSSLKMSAAAGMWAIPTKNVANVIWELHNYACVNGTCWAIFSNAQNFAVYVCWLNVPIVGWNFKKSDAVFGQQWCWRLTADCNRSICKCRLVKPYQFSASFIGAVVAWQLTDVVRSTVKVTGTSSWIKLVCQKLACITFPTKSYSLFTTTSHYRGHSAIVQHNTNLATVHSRVTVGGCSVEYEYKLLRQFARVVAHRMLYTSVLSIFTTSLQGHTKRFWKKNFPVCRSLFSKLLGTRFLSTQ